MSKLLIWAYRVGLLKPDRQRIRTWKSESNLDMLEFFLVEGSFKIREECVRALGELGSTQSEKLLVKTIEDPIKRVSRAAMKALEVLSLDHAHSFIIADKRTFWLDQEKREHEEALAHTSPSYTRPKRIRGSKKTLEQAKQMLKKPMAGGKWL